MALKVWIGENLDRRHEQEQMKEFLTLMHAFYDNQPTTVHVLCNFICGGSQIDAAVVKTDAFIPIEFKTAGGPVSGSENGKWRFEDPDTGRDIHLGGGSHASNPYNQVGNARTAIAQKLEQSENVFFRSHECERIADWRHFVHGLVVLAPNLEAGVVDDIDVDFYAKPWFDFCRIKDVAEVVSKTTTRDGELSNKNILKIIKDVLRLEEASIRDGVPVLEGVADTEEERVPSAPPTVPSGSFDRTLGDLFAGLEQAQSNQTKAPKPPAGRRGGKSAKPVSHAPLPSVQKAQSPRQSSAADSGAVSEKAQPISDSQVKTSFENIKDFVCADLPEYVDANAVVCARSNSSCLPVPIDGDWDYVIELKYKGEPNRALAAVDTYWHCPHTRPFIAGEVIVWRFPEATSEIGDRAQTRCNVLQGLGFLPPLVEDFILAHPHARYSPDALTASSNMTADAQRAEWYLGTYFPRSFCETFAIFDYIFSRKRDELKIGDKLSILDVGIGSGGAVYGLLWALRKWFSGRINEINIVGYDGNDHALRLCGEFSSWLTSKWDVTVNVQTSNVRISKNSLDSVLGQKYDFVLASKAIQETNGEFGYDDYASVSNSVLKPLGIAMVLEIFSEARQAQIKTSLSSSGASSRLLAASVEASAGGAFGVISNLTTQFMDEAVLFAVWGGSKLSVEGAPETEVVCHKPTKKTVMRKSNVLHM